MKAELAHAPRGNRFEVVVCSPAERLDLLREMSRVKPDIVHIIAHGGGTGSSEQCSCSCPAPNRDIIAAHAGAGEDALWFVDEDGETQVLSAAALERTFAAAGTGVRLAVFTACHSAAHAAPLLAHVEAVVSMAGPIHDLSAVAYTKGFYLSLGAGDSLHAAHKAGRAAIELEGLCDGERPQLQVRDDLRAERIFLAGQTRRSTARRKRKRAGEAVLTTRPRRRTPRRKRSDPGGVKQSSQPRRKRGDPGRAKLRTTSRRKH